MFSKLFLSVFNVAFWPGAWVMVISKNEFQQAYRAPNYYYDPPSMVPLAVLFFYFLFLIVLLIVAVILQIIFHSSVGWWVLLALYLMGGLVYSWAVGRPQFEYMLTHSTPPLGRRYARP